MTLEIMIVFAILTLFYQISNPDQGYCDQFFNQKSCLLAIPTYNKYEKSSFWLNFQPDKGKDCVWDMTEHRCFFLQYDVENFQIIIISI
jgi:hypothetical protein